MDGLLFLSSVLLTLMNSKNEALVIPRTGSSCPNNVICPSYIVIRDKSTNGYEYRRYDESKWIGTNHIAMTLTPEDELIMRRRLDTYFVGGNAERATIDRTLPVTLRVAPNSPPDGRSVFVMLRMLPPAIHHNTPAPTADSVFIQEVPPFNAFVRRFPGRLSFSKRRQKITSLKNDIGDTSRYYQEYFLLSEFESNTAGDVNNEAWLISTEHVLQNV
ncbi:heme-binding protein 2-like [Mizuhopecten yessoensis]|uniref:Heme-binding protein 2 n=1 Tax=Mizuhopecten yessoensis TaxID=6573 RepID=A0A210Q6X9_MIZYE|nr:heme-binding protein 2-like [Mizuhopecten yessoensis]OWF44497.1 Heme-binding protein 2 [Mizuhopecten yessoensis]